ncbi:TPA: hypothetical protein ACU3VF_004930 [Escherichia coli]
MKYAKNILFMLSLFMLFNVHAHAVYCSRLYTPDDQTIYDFGNIRLESGVKLVEKPLLFQYIGLGVSSAGYGNNQGSNKPGKVIKRYWMAYNHGYNIYNGALSIAVLSEYPETLHGNYAVTQTNYTYGYSGIVIPFLYCNSTGGRYSFLADLPFVNGIKLSIKRNGVYPGHYDISIPFGFAIEEDQYTDTIQTLPDWFAPVLLGTISSHIIKGSVDVISSCRFMEGEIKFNFGNISLDDALSGVKSKASFNISCTDPTRVKLSIQGGDQGPNMTSCGPGVCTVPIGVNGSSSVTTTVNPSRYWELQALFKTNKAFSGEFNGSLVLSMEII